MREHIFRLFLIIFEISDLKLVDIGTNIIKIGPEMSILELFCGMYYVVLALLRLQSWEYFMEFTNSGWVLLLIQRIWASMERSAQKNFNIKLRPSRNGL